MFVVHISSDKGKYVEDAKILKRYPVLQHYKDVFPIEILELPPHRELDLSRVVSWSSINIEGTLQYEFPRASRVEIAVKGDA